MKADIHPKNYKATTFICSCGNEFSTGSCIGGGTKRIDICSNCHPFYTGKSKHKKAAGRIDSFNRKYGEE